MNRRLQLLLDEGRYSRVAAEAERSERSVAAVIRHAIDMYFPATGDDERKAGAALLLSLTSTPHGLGESPSDLKDAYAEELAGKTE